MFFVLSSFVLSIHASAEDVRIEEAFVGYSLLHGDLQNKASGWEFSAGKNFTQWFSLHADFDAHHQSAFGSVRHEHDILLDHSSLTALIVLPCLLIHWQV